jgi:hypothetical protein
LGRLCNHRWQGDGWPEVWYAWWIEVSEALWQLYVKDGMFCTNVDAKESFINSPTVHLWWLGS